MFCGEGFVDGGDGFAGAAPVGVDWLWNRVSWVCGGGEEVNGRWMGGYAYSRLLLREKSPGDG